EELQADKLACQFVVHLADQLIRPWETARTVRRKQPAHGAKERSLNTCREQRRRNTFAHHVAQQHIQAGIAMPDEVVKVAIHFLTGNGKRGNAEPWKKAGNLAQKEGLLDLSTYFALAPLGVFQRAERPEQLPFELHDPAARPQPGLELQRIERLRQ